MSVAFLAAEPRQCRTPVGGEPGPGMLLCGAPTIPKTSTCPACRARHYYRPTKSELKTMDWTVGQPLMNARA